MDPLRVVVLDDYQAVAEGLADWGALSGSTVEFEHARLVGTDAVVERLAAADAVVLMRERTAFPAQVLDRLPRLRLLVTGGMRNAAIDLEAAARRGVTVCGVPGGSPATSELAWALLLALVRRVPGEDAAVRAGRWQSTVGTGLAGRTLGLAGLGNLGRLVNTARAGLVDRAALLDALHAGTIAGAALDVFDEEPVPADDPLLRAPRTVLTPHLGFVTRDNYAHWYGGAVQALRAFAAGSPEHVIGASHGSSAT